MSILAFPERTADRKVDKSDCKRHEGELIIFPRVGLVRLRDVARLMGAEKPATPPNRRPCSGSNVIAE